MASKNITILLLPEGTNRVRQFRFPRFLLAFFVLLLVSCASYLFWVIQDYQSIKAQRPLLVLLEKENEQKEKQFTHLARRIGEITEKMGELKEFDRKLRVMVNLETGEDSSEFQGVGGSDPVLSDPERTIAETHRELVRSMHRSLDNIDSEITLAQEDKAELHKFLGKPKNDSR